MNNCILYAVGTSTSFQSAESRVAVWALNVSLIHALYVLSVGRDVREACSLRTRMFSVSLLSPNVFHARFLSVPQISWEGWLHASFFSVTSFWKYHPLIPLPNTVWIYLPLNDEFLEHIWILENNPNPYQDCSKVSLMSPSKPELFMGDCYGFYTTHWIFTGYCTVYCLKPQLR